MNFIIEKIFFFITRIYLASALFLFLSVTLLIPHIFILPVQSTNNCVDYYEPKNTIYLKCGRTNIPQIHEIVGNTLLQQENKTWLLNSNLEILNGATLYINSSDVEWLKINSTKGNFHYILASGNLLINNTKISSWDSSTNYYALSNSDGPAGRSYLLTSKGNGSTYIHNSEIAHLGYDYPRSFGLTFYTGANSVISNNRIHDLWYGFYSHSAGATNITIKDNLFTDNVVYGIDPHSGTHDIQIINNTVHNNGKHGIICAEDCYGISVVNNTVYKNKGNGIMFYDNVSYSYILENNLAGNEEDGIYIHNSFSNSVYDNAIANSSNGIRITDGSVDNKLEDNKIVNVSNSGIYLLKNSTGNIIKNNSIEIARNGITFQGEETFLNRLENNSIRDTASDKIYIQ